MASISEVKTALQGKSRLDRFRITLPTPEGVVQEVMVKAAGLPGRTVGVVELKHKGATIKIGGEPTYNDWTITVYGEDYSEYERFFKWMNSVAEFSENTRGNPSDYKVNNVTVEQLGIDNSIIATATLEGVFPTTIDDISYDNESTDTLVEFGVTLSIDAVTFTKLG